VQCPNIIVIPHTPSQQMDHNIRKDYKGFPDTFETWHDKRSCVLFSHREMILDHAVAENGSLQSSHFGMRKKVHVEKLVYGLMCSAKYLQYIYTFNKVQPNKRVTRQILQPLRSLPLHLFSKTSTFPPQPLTNNTHLDCIVQHNWNMM
jgi:hypothetical protein